MHSYTSNYQDENAAQRNMNSVKTRTQPLGASFNAGVVKPVVSVASNVVRKPRMALGDISNINKAVQPIDQAKKKAAVGVPVSRPVTANYVNMMSDDVTPMTRPQESMMDVNLHHHYQQPVYQQQQSLPMDIDVSPVSMQDNVVESSNDPQLVNDYIEDIMSYLRDTEARRHPNPAYMSRQTDINAKMREILIDWLVEVHLKFKLRQETLYLTVNIIDRFLERRAVSRSKLQLVGCTAMLIASKYEEIYAPEVQDFVYVSDKAYTREQILAMESIMLNVLEFNVTVPYSMRFAERYVRLINSSEQFKEMVNFLIELTLQEYRFLSYMPSMVGAAAVSLALHLSGCPSWNSTLEQHTQYSENSIRQCVMELWGLAAKDNPKYRAVRKKYTSSKYHGVAKITINPPPFEQ